MFFFKGWLKIYLWFVCGLFRCYLGLAYGFSWGGLGSTSGWFRDYFGISLRLIKVLLKLS